MSMERISNDMAATAARLASTGAGKTDRAGKNSTGQTGGDAAAVSKLSTTMANGTQDLDKDSDVRPDKIAQFRAFVENPISLTDKQIDGTISKMLLLQ